MVRIKKILKHVQNDSFLKNVYKLALGVDTSKY